MDLELSDEQTWLAESVQTLLAREWSPPPTRRTATRRARPTVARARRLRRADRGRRRRARRGRAVPDRPRPRRAPGARAVPRERRAALRGRAARRRRRRRRTGAARAGIELGQRSAADDDRPDPGRRRPQRAQGGRRARAGGAAARRGGRGPDGAALAIVAARAPGVTLTAQPAFDATAPMYAVDLADAEIVAGPFAGEALERLATIGALMAAAEAVGAAGRLLDDACRYAGERRQFGRTIGSFQALRHLMADMYVRQASSWSSVLYAAAALDEDAAEAGVRRRSPRRTCRARPGRWPTARCRSSGASRCTAEHPAHRFLRRIVVREQQFGDAAHHERALGRALARRRRPRARRLTRGAHAMTPTTATGFNDPTAQRLEAIATGAEPEVVGPAARGRPARPTVAALRRRAHLGRQVQPHLPRRLRRRRGRPAPPAARTHPADRARHGPRAPRAERAGGHGRPGAARAAPSAAPTASSGRRSTSWSASSGTSAATRCPPGYADAPEGRAAIGEALVDVLAELHTVDPAAVGLEDFGRPAGFMERQLRRWSKQWEASKAHELPALDALRDGLVRTLPPAARGGDRPRRLPARQHGAAPDGAGPHRGRARLGDEHARRPVHRPRRAAGVLERGGGRRGAGRGAHRRARHRGRGLPHARAR